ncbi:hypothetical protein BJ741DRAFT_653137 [Chytriomyces cf. hyalinus JEL632]|nr:hypothetical protein BJ741DRAFT_653137 [Chytriomyces cf. hyalinus JEL632]
MLPKNNAISTKYPQSEQKNILQISQAVTTRGAASPIEVAKSATGFKNEREVLIKKQGDIEVALINERAALALRVNQTDNRQTRQQLSMHAFLEEFENEHRRLALYTKTNEDIWAAYQSMLNCVSSTSDDKRVQNEAYKLLKCQTRFFDEVNKRRDVFDMALKNADIVQLIIENVVECDKEDLDYIPVSSPSSKSTESSIESHDNEMIDSPADFLNMFLRSRVKLADMKLTSGKTIEDVFKHICCHDHGDGKERAEFSWILNVDDPFSMAGFSHDDQADICKIWKEQCRSESSQKYFTANGWSTINNDYAKCQAELDSVEKMVNQGLRCKQIYKAILSLPALQAAEELDEVPIVRGLRQPIALISFPVADPGQGGPAVSSCTQHKGELKISGMHEDVGNRQATGTVTHRRSHTQVSGTSAKSYEHPRAIHGYLWSLDEKL